MGKKCNERNVSYSLPARQLFVEPHWHTPVVESYFSPTTAQLLSSTDREWKYWGYIYCFTYKTLNSDIASMGYVYILFHTVIDTYLLRTWTVVVTQTSMTVFVNRTVFFILAVATARLPISECSRKVDRALLGCISYQVILKYNTYELMYSSFSKTNNI